MEYSLEVKNFSPILKLARAALVTRVMSLHNYSLSMFGQVYAFFVLAISALSLVAFLMSASVHSLLSFSIGLCVCVAVIHTISHVIEGEPHRAGQQSFLVFDKQNSKNTAIALAGTFVLWDSRAIMAQALQIFVSIGIVAIAISFFAPFRKAMESQLRSGIFSRSAKTSNKEAKQPRFGSSHKVPNRDLTIYRHFRRNIRPPVFFQATEYLTRPTLSDGKAEPQQSRIIFQGQTYLIDAKVLAKLTRLLSGAPATRSEWSRGRFIKLELAKQPPLRCTDMNGDSLPLEMRKTRKLLGFEVKAPVAAPSITLTTAVSRDSKSEEFVGENLTGKDPQQPPRELINATMSPITTEVFIAPPSDLFLSVKIGHLSRELEELVNQERAANKLILEKVRKSQLDDELEATKKLKSALDSKITRFNEQKMQYQSQAVDNVISSDKTEITIPAWVIKNDNHQKFAMYTVMVQRNTSDGIPKSGWVVGRRYSEFLSLHRTLWKHHPRVRTYDFPSQWQFSSFLNALLETRRARLEDYLKSLINDPEICQNSAFLKFLSKET